MFDEVEQSTDFRERTAMNELDAGPTRTAHWKGAKRLRILLAGLIALLMVYVVAGLFPGFLDGDWGAGLPCDRCITEQSVLEFLDGKTVFSPGSVDAAGSDVETITLRKERIWSLKFRSDDSLAILVRFNLDHQGKQCLVEGNFVFTTSDDPGIHYHNWEYFMGRVVSSR